MTAGWTACVLSNKGGEWVATAIALEEWVGLQEGWWEVSRGCVGSNRVPESAEVIHCGQLWDRPIQSNRLVFRAGWVPVRGEPDQSARVWLRPNRHLPAHRRSH